MVNKREVRYKTLKVNYLNTMFVETKKKKKKKENANSTFNK